MDYRIDWSPEAVEDVAAIAEYISRDSEMYATASAYLNPWASVSLAKCKRDWTVPHRISVQRISVFLKYSPAALSHENVLCMKSIPSVTIR
jgi:hypothetical protein